MKKFLLSPDKFKGSLSGQEVATALARGIRQASAQAETVLLPIADGGEGTAETLGMARHGRFEEIASVDAVGRPCGVRVAFWEDVAAFDVAAVVGLAQIEPALRNPWAMTTRGVGHVLHALESRRVSRILVGLGGSATNDAGVGMAAALGVRFLHGSGKGMTPCPETFDQIETIRVAERPFNVPIIALCDVINPLLGANGASHVYGPQKGLRNPGAMDATLVRLADRLAAGLDRDHRALPRAGAAGGLGYGLAMFCGATLTDGFETVSEVLGLEQAVTDADVVITGEGRIDRQTLAGKGPAGVARLARRHGKPVHAFCGTVEPDVELASLFDAIHALVDGATTIAQAMDRPEPLLAQKAARMVQSMECSSLA